MRVGGACDCEVLEVPDAEETLGEEVDMVGKGALDQSGVVGETRRTFVRSRTLSARGRGRS